MTGLKKLALAVLAAAFCASSPVIAADTGAPAMAKPDPAAMLKDKAASAIEQGKAKMDGAAAKLEKGLGIQQNATQPKSEVVDVNQETVTVQTPQGTATETTTTITPEAPAAPAAPEAPAAPAK